MVQQLESNLVFRGIVAEKVKYLTVDEYQDTNPVQERLVSLLKELGANLCVVGDDDQTIYQFRGSDSNNILTFMQRYNIKKYIVLDTDYRSTRGIVSVAKNVIVNNSRRLPKVMQSGCSTVYDDGDIVSKRSRCRMMNMNSSPRTLRSCMASESHIRRLLYFYANVRSDRKLQQCSRIMASRSS